MINTLRFWDRLRTEDHSFEPHDCVISISTPGSNPANIKGAGEVLYLEFHDVVERIVHPDGRVFEPITRDQVSQIVQTVERWEKHKEWRYITVHCDAGVSRSGAVAAYIFAYTWCYFPTAEMNTHPNKLILQMLEEVSGQEVVSTAAAFKEMGGLI